MQRLKQPGAGARARAARCRSSPATCPSAWSTSRAATPQRAGVDAAIDFHGGDALERPAPALPADLPGTLMLNPPYGERIEVAGKAGAGAARSAEDRDTPGDFFPRLAAHWKRAYTQHPAGWTAWVLSPDMKLPGAMRLKESRRVPMWNGPIECRLFRFDLVAGSARR